MSPPRSCGRRRPCAWPCPVSTPPGPSSAYSVTPRSSSSSRQCFQRTGDDSCADSRLAHSLPSWWGSASTLATTGTSVSRGSASAIAPRSGTRAEIMNGVWKAPDTGSGMTFLAPSSRAWSDAERDAGRRAGDDDLPGGVVVGDPDVLVGAPAGDVDLVVVETEDGGHRAGLGQPGLVHRLGAGGHEADAVVEPERAGGGQGGVLAEAVAGAEARLDAQALDGVEHHQARHERRQLGVAGVAQLVGVGVDEQLGDVTIGDLAGLLDELPALVIDPRPPHPGPLRPLAGEGEREHPLKGRRSHGAPLGLPTGNEQVTATLAVASSTCPGGEMAYAMDSKSIVREGVRVRVPPRAPRSVLVLAADAELVALDVGHHAEPVVVVVVQAQAGGAELLGCGRSTPRGRRRRRRGGAGS